MKTLKIIGGVLFFFLALKFAGDFDREVFVVPSTKHVSIDSLDYYIDSDSIIQGDKTNIIFLNN